MKNSFSSKSQKTNYAAHRNTVNIFLSSTFDRNMLVNRDKFRNEINARLNYIYGKVGSNVYIYDLELGVPEGTNKKQTLNICYDMINKSDYFICVLGYSYGSLVRGFLQDENGVDIVLEDDRYIDTINESKLSDLSITESEIIEATKYSNIKKVFLIHKDIYDIQTEDIEHIRHALVKCCQMYCKSDNEKFNDYALNYFDNDREFSELIYKFAQSVIEKLEFNKITKTPQATIDLVASNIDKMHQLIKKIMSGHYNNNMSDIYTFTTQSQLMNTVENHFHNLVSASKREYSSDESYEEVDKNLIYSQKMRYYVGVEKNIDKLNNYIDSDNNQILVLHGSQGSGKSSLLIDWEYRLRKSKPDTRVISYYVDANSNSAYDVIKYINDNLFSEYPSGIYQGNVMEKSLIYGFSEGVLSYYKRAPKTVIIIDGFDAIEHYSGNRGVYWLPKRLPPNIKFVISTTKEDDEKQFSNMNIEMPPVEDVIKKAFISEGKHLEYPKMQMKLNNTLNMDKQPIVGVLLSRDIMINAKYYNFDEIIDTYDKKHQNIDTVIDKHITSICRRYSETNNNISKKTLIYLSLSRRGLPKSVLDTLIGDGLNDFLFLMHHVIKNDSDSNVYFTNRSYMRSISKKYLQLLSSDEVADYRINIINAYMKGSDFPTERKYINEIAYQIYMSNNQELMTSLLLDIDRANFLSFNPEILVKYMRVADCGIDGIMTKLESVSDNKHYSFLAKMYEVLDKYDKSLEYTNAQFTYADRPLTNMDHKQTAKLNVDRAIAEIKNGEYDFALMYIDRSIQIYEKLFGRKNLNTAIAIGWKAQIYKHKREYSLAVKLQKERLDIMEELLTQFHPNLGNAYKGMALIYIAMKKNSKAIKFLDRALEIYRESLCENHRSLGSLYSNYGSVYANQKKYSRALDMYTHALEINKANSIEITEQEITIYTNVAGVYFDMGKYENALEYYKKALEMSEELFGEKHYLTATSHADIAMTYFKMGLIQKALEQFTIAEKRYREKFGENYHSTRSLNYHINRCKWLLGIQK